MACDPECQSQINALKCQISKLDKDIQTIWNNAFGDPEEKKNCLLFVADHGDSSAADFSNLQTKVNQLVENPTLNVVGILFGGDNNYPDGEYGTLGDNWEPYDIYITQKIVFPALGNHDLDNSGTPGQPQFDKFSYLDQYGSNRRYYHVAFDSMDTDLFVLNSGTDSSPSLIEADGIALGSEQYNWFISALQNSSNKFKIVMFHHPFVTVEDGATAYPKFITDMDWRFENLGVDLVLNGHAHSDFHIIRINLSNPFKSCNIVNCSAIKNDKKDIDTLAVHGSGLGLNSLQWHYGESDGSAPDFGDIFQIKRVGNFLHCSFISLDTGTPRYSFIIEK